MHFGALLRRLAAAFKVDGGGEGQTLFQGFLGFVVLAGGSLNVAIQQADVLAEKAAHLPPIARVRFTTRQSHQRLQLRLEQVGGRLQFRQTLQAIRARAGGAFFQTTRHQFQAVVNVPVEGPLVDAGRA